MSEQPTREKTSGSGNSEDPPVPETSTGLQYLLRTLHVLFIGLRVLIVFVIIWAFLGGMFYVEEDEKALLFRFGKLVSKDGEEVLTGEKGKLYWAWPYPVDNVVKVTTEEPITVETDHFWVQDSTEDEGSRKSEQMLQVGQDGYILTGDANIVHMVWSATYQISDVKQYYLGFKGAKDRLETEAGSTGNGGKGGVKAVVEDALCNSVIKEVGRWPVKDVIVKFQQEESGKGDLADAVEDRVKQELQEVDAGIEIQDVSLSEWAPPRAVSNAFGEINQAAQAYQRLVDQARQHREERVAAAQARKSEILADARAYKTRTLESVKAEANYFKEIHKKYTKRPDTTLISLYTDTLRRVLEQAESEYIIHTRKRGDQEIRLRLGPPPAKTNSAEENTSAEE